MATITSKRRRGQGKAVPHVSDAIQSASNAANNIGNGQAIEQDAGLPQKPSATRHGITYADLVSKIKADPRMIATCWHPAPSEATISLNNCDVRVLTGEAAYQLSSGEVIKL